MSTRSTIATANEWPKSAWHLFNDFYEGQATLIVSVEQQQCDGNYADDILDGVNVRLTPKIIEAIVKWRKEQTERE